MECRQKNNIEAKVKETSDKYQLLASETRENRVEYRAEVLPLVGRCLGGGTGKLCNNVQKMIETEAKTERIMKEMQKIMLMVGFIRREGGGG